MMTCRCPNCNDPTSCVPIPKARAATVCECGAKISYPGRGRPPSACAECRAKRAPVCRYCAAPVDYSGRGRRPQTCGAKKCRARLLANRPSESLAPLLHESEREAYAMKREKEREARYAVYDRELDVMS